MYSGCKEDGEETSDCPNGEFHEVGNSFDDN
jgi:hypothetical protein